MASARKNPAISGMRAALSHNTVGVAPFSGAFPRVAQGRNPGLEAKTSLMFKAKDFGLNRSGDRRPLLLIFSATPSNASDPIPSKSQRDFVLQPRVKPA